MQQGSIEPKESREIRFLTKYYKMAEGQKNVTKVKF